MTEKERKFIAAEKARLEKAAKEDEKRQAEEVVIATVGADGAISAEHGRGAYRMSGPLVRRRAAAAADAATETAPQ